MRTLVASVFLALLLLGCNQEKKIDSPAPSQSATPSDNSPAVPENLTVSPEVFQEKQVLVKKFDLGFVERYFNFPENTISESSGLNLDASQERFYEKFAGLYVRDPSMLSDSAPLNNLRLAEFSWGKDLYFITDYASVEFNRHDASFYAPHGDSDGRKIVDLEGFQLPSNWQLLSSVKAPGLLVRTLLERKKEKVAAANISRSIDDQKKVEIADFYTKVIATLLARDEHGLREFTTQALNTDEAFSQLKDLIGEVNEPRITQHGFYVVYNGFQNEDIEAFRSKYRDAFLLEFCFKDDSEFFSLGITQEQGGLKVCFARNGVSDL